MCWAPFSFNTVKKVLSSEKVGRKCSSLLVESSKQSFGLVFGRSLRCSLIRVGYAAALCNFLEFIILDSTMKVLLSVDEDRVRLIRNDPATKRPPTAIRYAAQEEFWQVRTLRTSDFTLHHLPDLFP